MAVYRVLHFEGGRLAEHSTLNASDHVEATIRAAEASKTDRIEVWLLDKKIAVLRPSKQRR